MTKKSLKEIVETIDKTVHDDVVVYEFNGKKRRGQV